MANASQLSVVFLRHGLSTANYDGVVQGQKDYPLHDQGIDQARRLSAYWSAQDRHFDRIVCSPLCRTRETAEILASALSTPIVEDPLWMERMLGEAEGSTYEQVRERLEAEQLRSSSYEPLFVNGESEWDLFNRAAKAVQSLLQSENNSCLVVSHGAFLSATLRAILGIPPAPGSLRPPGFRFENTGYTEMTFDRVAYRWQMLYHNAHPHLEQ
ncbi:MAG: histidine phosphatase family protein [Anaerolineales bacterium]|nr:MAG: histidine phosphatase family protein [Anaerolineales bacterium]